MFPRGERLEREIQVERRRDRDDDRVDQRILDRRAIVAVTRDAPPYCRVNASALARSRLA
jgi:hypothetical protein